MASPSTYGWIALASSLAIGAPGSAAAEAPPIRYEDCAAQAETAPAAALRLATRWANADGGAPAEHCAALALMALGDPVAAAERLEALTRRDDVRDDGARAALLGQAANARLVAEQPDAALAHIAVALRLAPGRAELHLDASRAHALKRDWSAAAGAADDAVAADPTSPEARALAARARWELREDDAARAQLRQALRLDPQNLEALVLQGEMRQEGAL
ncbi:MAG: hypothetical protein AAF527_10595 [Pseudomonadota bacterium]